MRRRWLWIVDMVWVLLLAGYAWAGYPIAPFHGDESINIAISADYHYRYLADDLDRLRYSDPPEHPIEQSYRMNDSPLIRYLIGAAWSRANFTVEDLNAPWWFAQDYQWNMDNGFYPGDDLLLASRVASTLLLIAGVVGSFLLGAAVAGRPAAYVASLYFTMNPVILLNGRRAMHEGIHLGFQVFILLIGLLWLQALATPGGRRWHLPALGALLGVIAGLGVAGKHTNVLPLAVVLLVIVTFTLVRARHRWRGALIGLGLVALTAGVMFLYWNPPLWGDPFVRAWMVASGRAEVLRDQIEVFDNSYRGSIWLSLQGMWQLVLVGEPMYFETASWRDNIGGQIATYETSGWAGFPYPYYNLALLPLVALGAWHLRNLHAPARWLLGAWGLFLLIYVLFMVPLGWQRYYMPALPAIGLFAGLG
ncbi:MAG: hypothetical protein AAF125_19095, partial [Chloroflexota bacterium]